QFCDTVTVIEPGEDNRETEVEETQPEEAALPGESPEAEPDGRHPHAPDNPDDVRHSRAQRVLEAGNIEGGHEDERCAPAANPSRGNRRWQPERLRNEIGQEHASETDKKVQDHVEAERLPINALASRGLGLAPAKHQ